MKNIKQSDSIYNTYFAVHYLRLWSILRHDAEFHLLGIPYPDLFLYHY